MTKEIVKDFSFSFLCYILLTLLAEYKQLVRAEDTGFYPGYVGALNDTINNLMTQLQVYQQYIDQAFQPLNKYDKIFKKPTGSFSPDDIAENLQPLKRVQIPNSQRVEAAEKSEQEKKVDSLDELLSSISAEADEMEKESTIKDTSSRISETTRKTESPSPGTLSFIDSDSPPHKNYHGSIDDRIQPIKLSDPELQLTISPPTSSINPCGIFDPTLLVGKSRRKHILWPWMASVGKQYKSGFLYKCGGAIVNARTILTSAHCFDGPSDLDMADIAGSKVSIAYILIHPQYRENGGYNDIAIVKLASPIEFNANVSPVCLPPNSQRSENILDKSDSFSWSTEWIYKNEDGVLALKVKNVHTRILNSSLCEDEIRRTSSDFQVMFPKGFDSTLLCVKSTRGRLCQSNTGGTLFARDKSGKSFLIGNIVKGEDSCGDRQVPSVYTRVAEFTEFLESA